MLDGTAFLLKRQHLYSKNCSVNTFPLKTAVFPYQNYTGLHKVVVLKLSGLELVGEWKNKVRSGSCKNYHFSVFEDLHLRWQP